MKLERAVWGWGKEVLRVEKGRKEKTVDGYTQHKSRRKGQWGGKGDSQKGDWELGEGKRRSTDMKFV